MNLLDAASTDARALGLTSDDVDPWVAADVVDGRLQLVRRSGALDSVTVTAPYDGVLRIRVGGEGRDRSSMLGGCLGDTTVIRPVEPKALGLVEFRSGDLTAAWDTEGSLHVGGLARTSGDGSMGGPGLRAGAILDAGRVTGWVDRFTLSPSARVFGGGESPQGPDIRGRIRSMRNVETSGLTGYDLSYLNVPWLWSPDGWGLLVHSGATVHADVGATVDSVLSLVTCGDVLDVAFFSGSPADMLRNYLKLTGLPGAMPDWALGTWLSRCTYLSEPELHHVLDEADAAGCPVDVVHVDGWQQGEVLVDLACNWLPDRERFPSGWTHRLQERGVHTSVWLNPYVPAASETAKTAAQSGLFALTPDGGPAESADLPDRLLLDFTNPQTLQWWEQNVRCLLENEGADALKADFGEEIPDDACFMDGRRGSELRNEYALLYQAATHAAAEASRLREGRAEAVALFCRSGTTGSQRYPCHWVGDSAATWSGLVAALRAALSLSASGFAWVSHDIGGFWTAGSDAHMQASRDLDPNHYVPDVDPELFVRWAQWGAFSPVMRFHGAGRREPFAYPGVYGELAVRACQVRRSLRPYLSGTAAETARSGWPVMAPMALAYPDHAESHGALQYLFGRDMLVAPILLPGGAVRLWVPPGTWRQLLGNAVLTGPGWFEVRCTLDEFPAFVRSDPEPTWFARLELPSRP